MSKPPLSHKIIVPGRKIDIYEKTDLAKTFARLRAEASARAKAEEAKAAAEKETAERLTRIARAEQEEKARLAREEYERVVRPLGKKKGGKD